MDASSLLVEHLGHLARMQGGMKNFGVPVVFIPIPVGASAPSKQRTQSIAHGPSGVRRWAALPRRSLSCISQPRHVRGQLALMRGSESDGVREKKFEIGMGALKGEPDTEQLRSNRWVRYRFRSDNGGRKLTPSPIPN